MQRRQSAPWKQPLNKPLSWHGQLCVVARPADLCRRSAFRPWVFANKRLKKRTYSLRDLPASFQPLKLSHPPQFSQNFEISLFLRNRFLRGDQLMPSVDWQLLIRRTYSTKFFTTELLHYPIYQRDVTQVPLFHLRERSPK
jgi:hypothetical protein